MEAIPGAAGYPPAATASGLAGEEPYTTPLQPPPVSAMHSASTASDFDAELAEREAAALATANLPGLEALEWEQPPRAVVGPSGRKYHSTSLGCLRPGNPLRRVCVRVVELSTFEAAILTVIICNCATMAWESPLDPAFTAKSAFIDVSCLHAAALPLARHHHRPATDRHRAPPASCCCCWLVRVSARTDRRGCAIVSRCARCAACAACGAGARRVAGFAVLLSWRVGAVVAGL